MNTCKQCGKATSNPKFCSRSCSATNSNTVAPRRKKVKVCKADDCATTIISSRTYCAKHKNILLVRNGTIGELRKAARYQAHAYARTLAREWAKANLDCSACWYCSYSVHVEVCHVKDLSDFHDDTPVAETYENNVIILCKNHHWEFDHNILNYAPEAGFDPALTPLRSTV